MTKQTKILLAAIFLPALLLVPAMIYFTLHANRHCADERISSRGHGSNIQSLAELQAVRDWRERAEKIEPGLGVWHNATDRNVFCKFRTKSGSYHCRAYAKPCQSSVQRPES